MFDTEILFRHSWGEAIDLWEKEYPDDVAKYIAWSIVWIVWIAKQAPSLTIDFSLIEVRCLGTYAKYDKSVMEYIDKYLLLM